MRTLHKLIAGFVAAMVASVPRPRVGWWNFNREVRREKLGVFYSAMRQRFFDPAYPGLRLVMGGAKNKIHDPGWNLAVVIDHPSAPNSGDPVRFGVMTGVAMLDEGDGGAGSTETVVDFGPGVYDLTVDDNEGTAIAVGDSIYYHDSGTGTGSVNLNNSATSLDAYFGIALEVVGTGDTTLINVLHVPLGASTAISNGAVDTAQLATGAVETAKIDANAVTSAKVEVGLIQYTDTQLTATNIKALRATNIEVVATPGASLAVIPVRVDIFLDHGGADFIQVNNSDQLALLYNASNEIAEIGSEAQCTTLLEAGSDAALFDPLDMVGLVPEANKAIDLDNNGAAEITTGNGTLSIRVWHVTVPMAAFT